MGVYNIVTIILGNIVLGIKNHRNSAMITTALFDIDVGLDRLCRRSNTIQANIDNNGVHVL